MGRPTIAEQIAKAAAEGDMAKVQALAAKLASAKPKKTKPKVKTKPVRVEKDFDPQGKNPKDSSDFISKAQDPKRQPKYIDEDGNEKVRARIVPFEVVKNRKNTFHDDLTENTDLIPKKPKGRTKQVKKEHREPVEKILVKCVRCNEKKSVWPGEVMHNNWSCDKCLTSNNKYKHD